MTLKKGGEETQIYSAKVDLKMDKEKVKELVNELSDLIDKCKNDFEEMALNPDYTFDLLLRGYDMLSELFEEVE